MQILDILVQMYYVHVRVLDIQCQSFMKDFRSMETNEYFL